MIESQLVEQIEARFAELERADVRSRGDRRPRALRRGRARVPRAAARARAGAASTGRCSDDLEGARSCSPRTATTPSCGRSSRRRPARLEQLEEEIRLAMVERDPNDDKNVLVEIRAGTGGDEAALFAGDLYKMLTRYAEERGFATEVLSQSPAEVGGFKEVTFASRARAPTRSSSTRAAPTASSGSPRPSRRAGSTPRRRPSRCCRRPRRSRSRSTRTTCRSTSTAPPARAASRSTRPTRRCGSPTSRPGSSSRCRTRSPSCRTRSGRCGCCGRGSTSSKLAEQQAEIASERRAQVGSGERSEKIRTYNFPQGRVTDHRIKHTSHNLDGVLGGDLGEFTDALAAEEKRLRLEAQAADAPLSPTGAATAPGASARRSAPPSTRSRGRGRDAPPRRRAAARLRRSGWTARALAADPEAELPAGAAREFGDDGAPAAAPRAGRLHPRPQGASAASSWRSTGGC